MQRISDGLPVPKLMMDVFTGKITNPFGRITLDLTYTPKSINDIILGNGAPLTLNKLRYYIKETLAGKTLIIRTYSKTYIEAFGYSDPSSSGSGGADPHNHNIQNRVVETSLHGIANETQKPIAVHYTVA